jgi:hypothetical protein
MRANGFLATEIPGLELETTLTQSLNVETLGGHDMLDFLVRESFEDSSLASVIEAKDTHPDLFGNDWCLLRRKQTRENAVTNIYSYIHFLC